MITAAKLLAEIGDCRARYPTRDALAADAGQAAVAIESGKRKVACFRWACNKRLRDAFCTLADSTRHWHPWAAGPLRPLDRTAATTTRARSAPSAAPGAASSGSAGKTRTPYDPARHRALQQHITVTIPTASGPVVDHAATQRMAAGAFATNAAQPCPTARGDCRTVTSLAPRRFALRPGKQRRPAHISRLSLTLTSQPHGGAGAAGACRFAPAEPPGGLSLLAVCAARHLREGVARGVPGDVPPVHMRTPSALGTPHPPPPQFSIPGLTQDVCLPRNKVSSTAISFNASDSRSFSKSAASSSTCSGEGTRPGFADANAANAASFANARNRTITLTSTPHFLAASACEISCEVISRKISHFSSGDSCRRGLRLPFSIITSSWFEAPEASQHEVEKRPDLYRELRRRPASRAGGGRMFWTAPARRPAVWRRCITTLPGTSRC